MAETVLVTGGAGFIGSHIARRLISAGYRVRALDNLHPQVHGSAGRPAYLDDDVELVVGDVRDRATVDSALKDVDCVIHLAARVGVGQSMYEIADYCSVNTVGTGVLLEALMDNPIRKLLVASSMSIYGEGLYETSDGRLAMAVERDREKLEGGDWEPNGPKAAALTPQPTPEWKPPAISSIYALNKLDQERMCLLFGGSYNVPTVALRLFNVYGCDQSLSNPYTGVLAIFAGRLLNGRPPLIFEDGQQRRDFVSVHDVAAAFALALERPEADGQALNIGSGASVTVHEVAERLAEVAGHPEIDATITRKYRVGDIRHCFADISLARATIGYSPQVDLEDGLVELADWLEDQVADDHVETATAELAAKGLTL